MKNHTLSMVALVSLFFSQPVQADEIWDSWHGSLGVQSIPLQPDKPKVADVAHPSDADILITNPENMPKVIVPYNYMQKQAIWTKMYYDEKGRTYSLSAVQHLLENSSKSASIMKPYADCLSRLEASYASSKGLISSKGLMLVPGYFFILRYKNKPITIECATTFRESLVAYNQG